MNREEILDLLPYYVAGSLGPEERRVVEEAIRGSAELREEIEFQLAFRAYEELKDEPHLSSAEIADYAGSGVVSRSERKKIAGHLQECAECREAYEMIGRTFPVKQPRARIGSGYSLRDFIRSLRPAYTVPAIAAMAVIVFLSVPGIEEQWEEKMQAGANLVDAGDLAAAEDLYGEALLLVEDDLEDYAPQVSQTLQKIAQLRESQGNTEGALVAYEHALAAQETAVAEGNEQTLQILRSIGAIYDGRKEYALSEQYYRRADVVRSALGLDTPLLFAEATFPPQMTFRATGILVEHPVVPLAADQAGIRLTVLLPRDIADGSSFTAYLAGPAGDVRPLFDTLTAEQQRLTLLLPERYFGSMRGEYLLLFRESKTGPDRDLEYRFMLQVPN